MAKKKSSKNKKKSKGRYELPKKKKKTKSKENKSRKIGDVINEYNLNVDEAIVNVEVKVSEKGLRYNIGMPDIGIGTKALLDDIRKELTAASTLGIGEMGDKKVVAKMKKKFLKQTSEMLKEKVPSVSKKAEKFLSGLLMQEMLGLGKLEFLINDPNLEEIVVVSSKEPVRVYHKEYGWLPTNIVIKKEGDIDNYANIIARRVGRQINVLSPLLDAHILTGDRANAVLYPIATKGNTITIRKFARDPFTIVDLINNKTVSLDVAALLWLAIEYEMNVLISGGTASGKTVFLN